MSLVGRIKEAMAEKGFSQYKLAIKAGIPHSTMSTLLNEGIKNPSVDVISKIAAALGVPVSFLLEEPNSEMIRVEREEQELDPKIMSTLKLLADDEGYFYEDLRKDIFGVIVSNLYMAHAFRDSSEHEHWERHFTAYFAAPEDHTDREHQEAIEDFNKAYEIRTIKKVLAHNNVERKEKFLSEIERIMQKHNIKNSSSRGDEKELAYTDIPIEDLMRRSLSYKGRTLTDHEKQHLAKILQAAAEMLEEK